MPAEITSAVEIAVHTPSGPVPRLIGHITYALTDDRTLDESSYREALGDLLITAGDYLHSGGALAHQPTSAGPSTAARPPRT